jgi:hypothetical protein
MPVNDLVDAVRKPGVDPGEIASDSFAIADLPTSIRPPFLARPYRRVN